MDHPFFMSLACLEAEKYFGATAPNPPVGAVAIDKEGNILAIGAHQKAGTPHAEIVVLNQLIEKNLLTKASTLYVTLEPCNHTGRTPPCVNAILKSPIETIVIGARDPHLIASGGLEALQKAGKKVILVEDHITKKNCLRLIAPFSKWITEKKPYIIVKTAHRCDRPVGLTLESMAPEKGEKTFSSFETLKRGHEFRKKSDALLTSTKTILIDNPSFTVRHVEDFKEKKRILSIIGKSAIDPMIVDSFVKNKLIVRRNPSFYEEFSLLGECGVHQVFVEAGPTLSNAILNSSLWDEHHMIIQNEYQIRRRVLEE